MYSDDGGRMRIAQPNPPRADENILNHEDEEKVKKGVCPRDGKKLEIRFI